MTCSLFGFPFHIFMIDCLTIESYKNNKMNLWDAWHFYNCRYIEDNYLYTGGGAILLLLLLSFFLLLLLGLKKYHPAAG